MPVLLDRPSTPMPTSTRCPSGLSTKAETGKVDTDRTPSSTEAAETPRPVSVVVVGARGLRNADWMPGFGRSDPYCVVKVQDRPSCSFKTDSVKNSLNPIWNHRGELQNVSSDDVLVFELYDKDRFKQDDLLGRTWLPASLFEAEGFDGDLPLKDAGKNVKASLHVRIAAPAAARLAKAERLDEIKFWPLVEAAEDSCSDGFKRVIEIVEASDCAHCSTSPWWCCGMTQGHVEQK